MTPTFNAAVKEYSVTTSNATNTITATPADENATVRIFSGEAEVTNGTAATWAEGENILTVTVTNGSATEAYTVTVTKS